MITRIFLVLVAALAPAFAAAAEPPRTVSELLERSTNADWRKLDPANTLYLQLDAGRVVIELAPDFAPRHVANIRALARQHFYDGLAIERVQDNFVVQWGDPARERPVGAAARTLPAEFTQPTRPALPFTPLPDADGYAPAVGFTLGLPAARDATGRTTWLAHCYGTVGVGRDNDADSGGGTELYVVIGHAPRQLDRNTTVAGRVVNGMELLAALPRGAGPLGFYEQPRQGAVIRSVRVAADLPVAERTPLELLRTDTPLFAQLVALRRDRTDEWYKVPAGYIDLCNVPLPVRISAPSRSG
ncbi:MAG: peptidylprolyl isomerase [Steroidobacteraceae bacterium]